MLPSEIFSFPAVKLVLSLPIALLPVPHLTAEHAAGLLGFPDAVLHTWGYSSMGVLTGVYVSAYPLGICSDPLIQLCPMAMTSKQGSLHHPPCPAAQALALMGLYSHGSTGTGSFT